MRSDLGRHRVRRPHHGRWLQSIQELYELPELRHVALVDGAGEDEEDALRLEAAYEALSLLPLPPS